MGLSMQTLKKQWTQDYWQKIAYNAKFGADTRSEHSLAIEHVCPLIINVCTLLSLLQLITRFKVPLSVKTETKAIFMGKQ